MTEQTIFAPETKTEGSEEQPTTKALPQEITEFVGEGKKYATVEDALKSVPHAQKHISTLEEELANMKEELQKRKTAEELISQMKQNGNSETTDNKSGVTLTPNEIEQIVQKTLTKTEVEKKTKTNTKYVADTFVAKFGEKAEEIYNQTAKEAGLSVEDFNKLAAVSPNAVLKLAGFDMKKETTIPTKTTGTVNTQAINSKEDPQNLSARVKIGASTKDLVSAWKIAGQKVGKPA